LNKQLEAVHGCRTVTKHDMVRNNWLPHITVDPQTYEVFANGELLTCQAVDELPMAQRYFLF
jgi:urease subunit alpha